ncbi:MAG: DUF4416 family protein, partial [Gemmatimonadota bacterium]|nr:DUF4416 family protein [Gemmatimonadota bacterium]
AIMAADDELIERAAGWLSAEIGPIDLTSQSYAFDFTGYYEGEMGPGLIKRFFSFETLRPPEHLAPLKRRCVAYERAARSAEGRRVVNIDPGYWSDAKLVLASTKNFSHRIAVGRRVFAEVTLRRYKGKLQGLDWTYPDYLSPLALEFFENVRNLYLKQLAIP